MPLTFNQFLKAVVARRPAPRRDDRDDAETPCTEDELRRLAAARDAAIAADNARRRRQRKSTRFCDEDRGEPERLLPAHEIRRALWYYSAIPPRQRTVTIAYLAHIANLSRMHVYRIRNGQPHQPNTGRPLRRHHSPGTAPRHTAHQPTPPMARRPGGDLCKPGHPRLAPAWKAAAKGGESATTYCLALKSAAQAPQAAQIARFQALADTNKTAQAAQPALLKALTNPLIEKKKAAFGQVGHLTPWVAKFFASLLIPVLDKAFFGLAPVLLAMLTVE